MVKGMGGAMDLVASAKNINCCNATGNKVVKASYCECYFNALTGVKCIKKIVTELGVYEVLPEGGFKVLERAPGIPVFNDLYWQPGGNINLNAETAHFHLVISPFYIKIKDMIRWLPTANGYWAPINTDNVESYGSEVQIDYRKKITENHNINAQLGYSFTKSVNSDTQKQLMLMVKSPVEMWGRYSGICDIKSVTNAQDFNFWADRKLYAAKDNADAAGFDERKKIMKYRGFKIVSDQTGKIFNPNIFTMVWARRFAGYKRADLLLEDKERFQRLMENGKYPIQISSGLVNLSISYPAVPLLTVWQEETLKRMSDVWLNNPRVPCEASGTSGMTAAMNGSVNFSTEDGWIPEFAKPGENSFVVPKADYINMSTYDQDMYDLK
ncbi:hypothetical protein FQR65_LT15499 [Abscondita terminalis]|nr:hypothetical protein FQR65_LT15499 [Abscondita terminalis]